MRITKIKKINLQSSIITLTLENFYKIYYDSRNRTQTNKIAHNITSSIKKLVFPLKKSIIVS